MKVTNSNATGGSNDGNNQRQNANASERNQRFEETTFSTLDAICRSSEETYDKLMKGFVYLRPENVQKAPAEDEGPPPEFLQFQQKLRSKNRQTDPTAGPSTFYPEIEDLTIASPTSAVDPTSTSHSSNVIEEEVLAAGTTTKSYLMRSDGTSKSLKVKVGNFVDEDENSESEEDDMYSPSFNTEQGTSVTSSDNKPSPPEENNDVKNTNTSTNSSKTETTDCSCDASGNQASESEDYISGNQSMLSSSNCNNELQLPMDNQQVQSDSPSVLNLKDTKCCPPQSTETDDLLDLVGQYSSEDSEELVYDPSKDMPNFGEIEDEVTNSLDSAQNMVKETLLEFKVLEGSPGNGDVQETDEGNKGSDVNETDSSELEPQKRCSDEVEAFALDNDFDYNNVTLTPKYNAEEMAIMMNTAAAASQ